MIAVSAWLAKLTADHIMNRAELGFSKKLEKFKSELSKKGYISKVRFDLEIQIYQQLSEYTLNMVFDNGLLFPIFTYVNPDKEEQKKTELANYEKAAESYNMANSAIMKNAPFIPSDIYDKFIEIREECRKQLAMFSILRIRGDGKSDDFVGEQTLKCYDRTMAISDKLNVLLSDLRKHITGLDVLDT